MLNMIGSHGQRGKDVPGQFTDLFAVRHFSVGSLFDDWSSLRDLSE